MDHDIGGGERELQQPPGALEAAADRDHWIAAGFRLDQHPHRVGTAIVDARHADVARATEQRQRRRFAGEQPSIVLQRIALDIDALSIRPHRPAQPCGQVVCTRLIGAVEQEQANIRAGLVQPRADLCFARLHLVAELRAYRASRATIWSATMPDSRSSALRSAAIVAYSEPATSMPASDPAVASSTVCPVARSIS